MCQKDDASLFRVGKAQNKMGVSVSLTMAPGTAFVTGVLLCLGTCFSAPGISRLSRECVACQRAGARLSSLLLWPDAPWCPPTPNSTTSFANHLIRSPSAQTPGEGAERLLRKKRMLSPAGGLSSGHPGTGKVQSQGEEELGRGNCARCLGQ